MYYLNILAKHRLTSLSCGNDTADVEKLSCFGGRNLFPVVHFRAEQVAYRELKAIPLETLGDYETPWREFRGSDCMITADGVWIRCEDGNQRLSFSVDGNTVMPNRDFSPWEIVYIYADVSQNGLPVAQMIVGRGVHDMVKPYLSASVRREALEEFFELDEAERKVLYRFLTDPDYGAMLLNALGYLSLQVIDRRESVEVLLRELNKVEQAVVEDLRTLLGIQQLTYMLCLDFGSNSKAGAHSSRPWVDYLAMYYAFRQRESADNLLNRWKRCISELVAVARFSGEEEMDELVEDVLELYKREGNLHDEAEQFLFDLLLMDSPLRDHALQAILNALFADSINSAQLGAIGALKKGQHIERIREYISEEFQKRFKSGAPKFVWLVSALWAHDRDQLGESPVELGREELLEAPFSEGALVSMAALSLIAWSRRVGGMPLHEYKLDRFTGLERVLYMHLSKPKQKFYRWAVSIYYDFALNSYMDRSLLEKQGIIRGCFKALKVPVLRESAEMLLALFPGRLLSEEVTSEMRNEYLVRLEKVYVEQNNDELVKLFRICTNIGVFPDRETVLVQFKRLVAALAAVEMDFNEDELHPDAYCLFRFSCQELLNKEELTETSGEALEALCGDPDHTLYEKAFEQLEKDEKAVFTLNTDVEMGRFLSACRAVDNDYLNYQQREELLRSLAARSQILAKNLGSWMVTNWFTLLCRYGLGQRAFEFYKAHEDLLNKPCFFYSTRAHHHGEKHFLFFDWNRFLESTPERVVEAVAFSGYFGNKVYTTFKQAAESGQLNEEIARKILDLPVSGKAEKLDDFDRKIRACSQYEHDFPKNIAQAFSKSYDDFGILNLLNEDEKRAAIDFGYEGILKEKNV